VATASRRRSPAPAECFAAARLRLGGPTLPEAADARRLIELAPYRQLLSGTTTTTV
jgi:hypothetical protein